MSYRNARYDVERDEDGTFVLVAYLKHDVSVPVGMISEHFPQRLVQEIVRKMNEMDPTCAIVRERERA